MIANKEMKTVHLNAHSKKGKELVKEFGNTWQIIEHRAFVPILNAAGFNIQPPNQPDKARWIHQNGDPDFQIIWIE